MGFQGHSGEARELKRIINIDTIIGFLRAGGDSPNHS